MIAPNDLTTEGALPDGNEATELSPVSAIPEAPRPSMSNPAIPDSIRLVGNALIVCWVSSRPPACPGAP